jgi:hypothetical protein
VRGQSFKRARHHRAQAARVFRIGGEDISAAAPTDRNLESVSILRLTLAILGAITLTLFFLPFALFARVERGPGFWLGSGYFCCIGLGFMLLELPWIQQSILFLGHPSYAAAVVIAALLLGAGTGAAWVSRVPEPSAHRLFLLLPLAAAAVSFVLGAVFRSALDYPWLVRIGIAAALFAVAGFFVGTGIPLGFIRFGDRRKAWFWAVNGAASVFTSALSIAFAMAFGFFATSMIGVACYVAAAALLARNRRGSAAAST